MADPSDHIRVHLRIADTARRISRIIPWLDEPWADAGAPDWHPTPTTASTDADDLHLHSTAHLTDRDVRRAQVDLASHAGQLLLAVAAGPHAPDAESPNQRDSSVLTRTPRPPDADPPLEGVREADSAHQHADRGAPATDAAENAADDDDPYSNPSSVPQHDLAHLAAEPAASTSTPTPRAHPCPHGTRCVATALTDPPQLVFPMPTEGTATLALGSRLRRSLATLTVRHATQKLTPSFRLALLPGLRFPALPLPLASGCPIQARVVAHKP